MKYAYLEKTVSELSEVLWRQQQELDSLKEGYRGLKDTAGFATPAWSTPAATIARPTTEAPY